METNPVFSNNIAKGATCILKIAKDLGQILVVLHTLQVIIEMPPRLNKQSGSDRLCSANVLLLGRK